MNRFSVVGLFCVAGSVVFAFWVGTPVVLFVNLRAFLIGPVATLMLLIATFGFGTVASALRTGFRFVFLVNRSPTDSAFAPELQRVAMGGVKYATLTGFIGTFVGVVTLYQSSDPEQIGPALDLAVLSGVYAALSVVVVYYPMLRQAEQHMKREHELTSGK